jgi:hypothetical protein
MTEQEHENIMDKLVKASEIALHNANELFIKSQKAYATLIKMFWIVLIPLVGLLTTGAVIGWQGIHNAADIEWIRMHAYNRQAAIDESDATRMMIDGLTKLYTDSIRKPIVDDFNFKYNRIMGRIQMTESEIVLRGIVIQGHSGSSGGGGGGAR